MTIEKNSKTEYDQLIDQMIELEEKRKDVLRKLEELEKKEDIPYLRFATLCKWSHYKEVHALFNKWRKYIEYVPSDIQGSQHGRLIFKHENFDSVFVDLVHLINHDVIACSLSEFSRAIVELTNLGDSKDTVYKRLKRYKKIYK